jgi:hypothetical protein
MYMHIAARAILSTRTPAGSDYKQWVPIAPLLL